jgi:hypothetical protein
VKVTLLCPVSGRRCGRNCEESPENPELAGLCERLGFARMLVALAFLAALAGCGTAATTIASGSSPARPPLCTALLGQIRAFEGQAAASQKNSAVMTGASAATIFGTALRSDAAAFPPTGSLALWTAELDLTRALQAGSAARLNAALGQARAACGG